MGYAYQDTLPAFLSGDSVPALRMTMREIKEVLRLKFDALARTDRCRVGYFRTYTTGLRLHPSGIARAEHDADAAAGRRSSRVRGVPDLQPFPALRQLLPLRLPTQTSYAPDPPLQHKTVRRVCRAILASTDNSRAHFFVAVMTASSYPMQARSQNEVYF